MARQHGQDLVGEVLAVLAGPEGRSDPYPHYERLRGLGPVALGPDGTLVATGYRVCAALLRDHRLGKTPERLLSGAGYADWLDRPSLRMMFTSMLMVNPPGPYPATTSRVRGVHAAPGGRPPARRRAPRGRVM